MRFQPKPQGHILLPITTEVLQETGFQIRNDSELHEVPASTISFYMDMFSHTATSDYVEKYTDLLNQNKKTYQLTNAEAAELELSYGKDKSEILAEWSKFSPVLISWNNDGTFSISNDFS